MIKNKTTQDMFEDLLNVLAAAMIYIDLKDDMKNPFVRKLGEEKEEQEAFEILKTYVANAHYLMDEIETLVEQNASEQQAEKDLLED